MRIANTWMAALWSGTWEESITAMCKVLWRVTWAAYKRRVWTGVAVRVQVKKTRFRIPDVTVVAGAKPTEPIIRKPPVIAIEVLSPDDRAGDLEDKIADYLAFGVPYVWVINPESRRAHVHTQDGSREVKDGLLRAESIEVEVPLAEIFA
jgi:Uma2 family endonuclease